MTFSTVRPRSIRYHCVPEKHSLDQNSLDRGHDTALFLPKIALKEVSTM